MKNQKYHVIIRFYEELNDFLSKEMHKKDIEYSFPDRRSIKDLIESIGVPHVEVDLILVNGKSVDFSYIVQDKDRISVYPVFERFSINGVTKLRDLPLRDLKFILDVHLGKLAKTLRLLGFDANYQKNLDDDELAMTTETENRILLTRDVQLLKRKNISRGVFIRSTDPEKQVLEILKKFDLWSQIKPFERCMECNGKIIKISDNKFAGIKNRIPKGVLSWCKEYYICDSCRKIYWKGSHYEKLEKFIERINNYRKDFK